MPDPVTPPINVVTPGLVEKEPDTCGAADLQGLVGQPSGMIRTVRVKGQVRMIGPGELVSQEYNAHRVDVHTDANGLIRQISCG